MCTLFASSKSSAKTVLWSIPPAPCMVCSITSEEKSRLRRCKFYLRNSCVRFLQCCPWCLLCRDETISFLPFLILLGMLYFAMNIHPLVIHLVYCVGIYWGINNRGFFCCHWYNLWHPSSPPRNWSHAPTLSAKRGMPKEGLQQDGNDAARRI